MQALNHSSPSLQARSPAPLIRRLPVSRRPLQVISAASQGFTSNVLVRPYTLRKGDTLDSIAQKRDINVSDIRTLNPDLAKGDPLEGKTILLPAQKLSLRDKDILSGIGKGFRAYPVRAGETLNDIISKRNITRAELEAMNPGVNLDKLEANHLLKLPTDKFTVREREMLIGSRVLPPEFFQVARNPFVLGVGVLMVVCGFVLAWQRFHPDKDFVADE